MNVKPSIGELGDAQEGELEGASISPATSPGAEPQVKEGPRTQDSEQETQVNIDEITRAAAASAVQALRDAEKAEKEAAEQAAKPRDIAAELDALRQELAEQRAAAEKAQREAVEKTERENLAERLGLSAEYASMLDASDNKAFAANAQKMAEVLRAAKLLPEKQTNGAGTLVDPAEGARQEDAVYAAYNKMFSLNTIQD